MKISHFLLPTLSMLLFISDADAQILKKLKEKASKTLNMNEGDEEASSDSQPALDRKEDNTWCQALTAGAGTIGGVSYNLAYRGEGDIKIFYDESALGIKNNPNEYRLILSEKKGNAVRYVVVENGKVIHTDTKVKPEYVIKHAGQGKIAESGNKRDEAMKKYVVADTIKMEVAKTDSKTVTVNKVDDDQFEAAMAMMRQTEDYQSMTEEEKKELEAEARASKSLNNSMAGNTYTIPGQQGGTYAGVTGYFVQVKGKKLAKFMAPPVLEVSDNESSVFAVGIDENTAPILLSNGKKTPLNKNNFTGMNGKIFRSTDQSRFVYLEPRKMSDKEVEELASRTPTALSNPVYNLVRSDGTISTVTDYTGTGKFKVSKTGSVISLNTSNGQVFADNKVIGKFPMNGRSMLDIDALLLGNDNSQIAYYNGDDGSLSYLDGTVKNLDIIYPSVVTDKGQSHLTWFRKCGNQIYIARSAF